MTKSQTLTFYLNDSMRKRAIAGQTNIINRIANAFKSCGYQCLFRGDSAVELLNSVREPGYSIFHMEDPFHPRALNLRRTYYYPFWQLEASAKKWEWKVASAEYDPSTVDQETARNFANFWRKRLFGALPNHSTRSGIIFAPLQGRLLDHRSFQAMSPMKMLEKTLDADPDREVYVTLHPSEKYSAAESKAVAALAKHETRLTVVSTEAKTMLKRCDYVVTQNSSVALDGLFHNKPAVLFADIDFHHITHNVRKTGVKNAFKNAKRTDTEFDKYLFWFLQRQSINAGRDDAEERILATVRSHGWAL